MPVASAGIEAPTTLDRLPLVPEVLVALLPSAFATFPTVDGGEKLTVSNLSNALGDIPRYSGTSAKANIQGYTHGSVRQ